MVSVMSGEAGDAVDFMAQDPLPSAGDGADLLETGLFGGILEGRVAWYVEEIGDKLNFQSSS